MKLAFLLGSPDISGGTNVIFEHGVNLQKLGYHVTVITKEEVESSRYDWHPEAGTLEWKSLDAGVDELFDIVFATWWQSVFLLEKLRARKYVYFIQSIESRFFPPQNNQHFPDRDIDTWKSWCHATYHYPLTAITEARWIQKYLADHFTTQALLVPNGIRKDIFKPEGEAVAPRSPENLRILIEGPLGVPYKNVEKTIELCTQAGMEEIWLLTSSDVESYPGVSLCFSQVPISDTAAIYRSCDILVKLSTVEGMFGPPLEMFHCGGTAIAYEVTGHDEYMEHMINSVIVPQNAEKEVVDWLKKLQSDQKLLHKLKQGGLRTASKWPSWQDASEIFHKVITSFELQPGEKDRFFLKNYTDFFRETRDHGLKSRELVRFAEREQEYDRSKPPGINFVQVYRSSEPETELIGKYQSGAWTTCSISLSPASSPEVIRIDPSVRIGIIAVKSIVMRSEETGNIIHKWTSNSNWEQISLAGSALLIRQAPYPIIEAIGEDPQLYLPELDLSEVNGNIRLELEIFEMGFGQALVKYSTLTESGSFWNRTLYSIKSWLSSSRYM